MRRRRLTFNLTALLDVVLLMIFAYQIQSLQQVEAASDLKARADEDVELLLNKNDVLTSEADQLRAEIIELQAEAFAKREPSALAETLEDLTALERMSLERALEDASSEDREQIAALMKRLQGHDSEEVVRELAKLESYSKYISSWTLYLEGDRGFDEGVSQLRVVVDDTLAINRSLGGTEAEIENRLQKLLRQELGGQLSKSQRLVVLSVVSCNLYKRNKDKFIGILERVFRGLKVDDRLEGTEFIFRGEQEKCQIEE